MNHAKGNTEIHSFQAIALTPEAAAVAVGARIIYLSWAQTFGRPPSARLPGMTARVLPFRRR
ncbi:hypothetical protein MEME101129_28100 [Methylobacterium mesophilicum]